MPFPDQKKKVSLQSLGLNGVNFMPFVLMSSDPKWDIPVSKPPGHSLRVTWPEEWESWLDLQDCDWAEGPVLSQKNCTCVYSPERQASSWRETGVQRSRRQSLVVLMSSALCVRPHPPSPLKAAIESFLAPSLLQLQSCRSGSPTQNLGRG